MVKSLIGSIAVASLLALTGCGQDSALETTDKAPAPQVIPVPAKLSYGNEGIIMPEVARVSTPDSGLFDQFSALVQSYTDVSLKRVGGQADIRFVKAPLVEGEEAYRIDIDKAGVTVSASGDAGLFYGAMTLAQMLDGATDGTLAPLAIGTIEDAPRLQWRGAMLDVARHFRSKEFIKKFLDVMAAHKLNVFHWHMTDDQAWRLEIKKYPKLTEVGGCRVPAGDGPDADIDEATGEARLYCGFYTQDDVREIVAYAAARHITVMPEIDLPGHATAAIKAYPELGTAKLEGDMSDWGIFQNTFNLEEGTITFLEDVMDETLELFPSEFIHIGGDEVATKQWSESARIKERMAELGIDDVHHIQAYFTRHFANYLDARGRRLIGWDEILEGGSIGNSAIMSWRGTKGGIEAAKAGRQVVMAPSSIYYTDYRQSDSRHEPPGREHIQTLEDVYEFEPVSDELTAEEQKAILGAEMTIFSEHMRTPERVEHMVFPRLLAVAESVWSDPAKKNFDEFAGRLAPHMDRLKALGIRPADSAFAPKIDVVKGEGSERTVTLSSQTGVGMFRYTLDGSAPTADAALYEGPINASAGQAVKAAAFWNGEALSGVRTRALDAVSLSERTSDELALCSKWLSIKLDDDFPRDGDRAAMLVDIIQPCWMYDVPDMAGVTGIEVAVGNLPYNFQIGDQINDVILKEPETDVGEIVVFKNSCDTGEEIARLPLAPATNSFGITTLTAPLDAPDAKALCFHVAASHYEPIWAIDRVRLTRD
ncbi:MULTISPECIES: beta-N-acetylhexosaminidase [Kordiimonas]|jgi:hexosaminidase|uniref:beta-N-acetylhexosaminidase n=1 Tax=Kordiimonas TaxID=288021 RepID=UPI00257B54E5|nr:family 20 glycosylhydrolase [Kordiimonas sp. UBA4487]